MKTIDWRVLAVVAGMAAGVGNAFAADPFLNGDFESSPIGPVGTDFAWSWGDINPARATILQDGTDKYAHLQGTVGNAPFGNTFGGIKQTFDAIGLAPLSSFDTVTVSFAARGYGLSRVELGDGTSVYANLTDADASANSNVAPASYFNITKSGSGFENYSFSFALNSASVVNLFFKSDFTDYSLDVNSVTVTGSNVSVVPEPESYAMMLAGLGALGFMARRRKTN